MPNNFPDWSGTWTNVKGFAGKTPWFTENWSALVDRTEDIAQVIDTATAGYTTLNDRLNDFTTVADVEAIVGGGGTPSNIPITSLGVGTAIANQKIKVNPSGTGIIGVNDVNDITELSVGTATADQLIRVNSAGNGIEGISPVIFVGGIPSSFTVWNQTSTNTNLTTTVDKTSLFTSRYTNNCSYISDGTNDVVQITETGFFRVVFTGLYVFQAVYGSSGTYSFSLIPYLLDSTSKAVIRPSFSELLSISRFFGVTNTGGTYIQDSFSMERIYYNSSGTLNVGAYINCSLGTSNSATRSFYIYYPRLIVTRVF